VSSAAEVLSAAIREKGPIPFSHFMEVALYHPEFGYYRTERDPFGKQGDYFTATQLQPVFGRLMASAMSEYREQLSMGEEFAVVEWGAGRGEMEEHLRQFRYFGLDRGRGSAPESFSGVVFSNELFDALPVEAVRVRDGKAALMRVGLIGGSFSWVEGEEVPADWTEYVERALSHFEDREDVWLELPIRLDETLAAMAAPLRRGFIICIDYGYTDREIVRFPRGTLMSYRRHQASEAVLSNPGEQDITAHVPFSRLQDAAVRLGLKPQPLKTMASYLMARGAADEFSAALAAEGEDEALRLRLQLKTLLFGMGETFRCAVFEKAG
jgi:SAM-dependent MidA family methyltransferase